MYKDLFISYGRKESLGFAGRIHRQLKLLGFDAWFDKVNIPDGEDYSKRIRHGIESAHNFAYVMAPRALCSPYCLIELEYARLLGKRIIPINQMVIFEAPTKELSLADREVLKGYYRVNNLPDRQINSMRAVLDRSFELVGTTDWLDGKEKLTEEDCEELADWAKGYENFWDKHDDLNYLNSFEFPEFGQSIDPLDAVIESIVSVIERQKPFVEKHTEILSAALLWERNQRKTDKLLVGKQRKQSEEWLLTEFTGGKQPPCLPSDLHCDFICAGRKNAENLMTDVFICYDVDDKGIRDKVIRSLSRFAVTTWVHDKDIAKGHDYGKAIEEGIEKADNFFFFISPQSVHSKYCLIELEHAFRHNKRIIPLLIEETPSEEFPEIIKGLQYINFTDNKDQIDFDEDIDDILNILNQDQAYYEEHKMMLARALQWQKEGRKTSFLLRGFNLENARTWLRLNENRDLHPPTEIHREFILASEAAKGQLGTEVFISYSRKDADFARKLNRKLQETGKTTWFDQESISTGVDFEKEIYKGIDSSDNFLFVISQDSVASEYCEAEVRYAVENSKRIITILWKKTDTASMPDELRVINWIDFETVSFDKAFPELIQSIDLDRDHARMHTILQQRSVEWNENEKSTDFLMNATACSNAETWLEEGEKKTPKPTALQKEYILESRKAINFALLKELKTKKRLKGFLVFAVIGLIGALVAGAFALKSYLDAKESEELAKNSLLQAKISEQKALDSEKLAVEKEKEAEKKAEENFELFKKANEAKRQFREANKNLKEKEQELELALDVATRATMEAENALAEAKIEQQRSQTLVMATKALVLQSERRSTEAINLISMVSEVAPTLWNDPPPAIKQALFDVWNNAKHYQEAKVTLPISIEKVSTSLSSGLIGVSGSNSSTVYLLDKEGNIINTLEGEHTNNVRAVAVSPSGELALTGGEDSKLVAWNAAGNPLFTLEFTNWVHDLVFDSSGRYFLVVSAYGAYRYELNEDNSGANLIAEYQGHNSYGWNVNLSSSESKVLTTAADSTVIIWSWEGDRLGEIKLGYSDVRDAKFTPGDEYIITVGNSAQPEKWDGYDYSWLNTFNGHYYEVYRLAMSKKWQYILTGGSDQNVILWDYQGREVDRFVGHKDAIYGLEFLGNDRILTASNDKSLIFWKEKPVNWYVSHDNEVYDVVFMPDSESYFSGSRDGKVKKWNLEGSLQQEYVLTAVHTIISIDVSPDGSMIAAATFNNDVIIWDVSSGEIINTLIGHINRLQDIQFSNDSKKLVSVSSDYTGRIWELSDNSFIELSGHNDQVWEVEISPEGNEILTGSFDGTAIIWDFEGNQLRKLNTNSNTVLAAAFSPDGKYILTGNYDQRIRLWSREGQLLKVFNGHRAPVHELQFNNDSKTFVSVSEDKTAMMWDLEGNILYRMACHTEPMRTVALSPDGNYILTGSDDKTVRLWYNLSYIQEKLRSIKLKPLTEEEKLSLGVNF